MAKKYSRRVRKNTVKNKQRSRQNKRSRQNRQYRGGMFKGMYNSLPDAGLESAIFGSQQEQQDGFGISPPVTENQPTLLSNMIPVSGTTALGFHAPPPVNREELERMKAKFLESISANEPEPEVVAGSAVPVTGVPLPAPPDPSSLSTMTGRAVRSVTPAALANAYDEAVGNYDPEFSRVAGTSGRQADINSIALKPHPNAYDALLVEYHDPFLAANIEEAAGMDSQQVANFLFDDELRRLAATRIQNRQRQRRAEAALAALRAQQPRPGRVQRARNTFRRLTPTFRRRR